MPKTGTLLTYLGLGVLFVTIVLQQIIELNPIVHGFLLGMAVGLFFAFFLIRFHVLKEEANKSFAEKEKKLQEIHEFIKTHEK